ncbi:MAG TPA: ABC transporter ATP-binding protein [Iamia sp.]|nr:ABC transporter ATP-binding protein [Iamia sp.]
MAHVALEGLTKQFKGKPPTTAVDALDLDIPDGEFLVLLGPSGCGKTTTLRCLAGLETAEAGRIRLGDTTVFDSGRGIDLPPDKRNLGMVFQSYALWPNMTVRKNIAYPLKARKMKKGLADGWVESTAEVVDCGELLDRYPGQLSGGQQQRVALARGLVARPELVLFDEPLSNLDARLRELVRSELAELHARLGFTAVYVTHDQSEALALGDRMAIMRAGRIEQLGTPMEVFQGPRSEYVAAFIGMEDRLELEVHDGGWRLAGEPLGGDAAAVPGGPTSLVARLRSDDLSIHGDADAPPPPGAVTFKASVVVSAFGGRHFDVTLGLGDLRLQARVPATREARSYVPGEVVTAMFDPADAALFDGGIRVADPRSVMGPPVTAGAVS